MEELLRFTLLPANYAQHSDAARSVARRFLVRCFGMPGDGANIEGTPAQLSARPLASRRKTPDRLLPSFLP